MDTPLETHADNGVTRSTIWNIDGIRLGHAVSRFKPVGPTELSGRAAPGEGASGDDAPKPEAPDVVRLHFGLRGNYSFTYRQLGRTFDLIGGHHNLMYSREFNISVEPHSPEIETFGVQFPRDRFIELTRGASDALQRFAQHIIDGENVLFSEYWGALDPGMETVIRQIIQCAYGGDLKRLFLLSKSIELLVLSADACAEQKETVFLKNKTDRERIIAARDLVNGRLDDPPNLSEIARSVGLNEYKLKRGFKETFRNTVFGYLSEQRLQLAMERLRDTDKTAAEIAVELGYASPQHFNNAFKKKFGRTPQSVRINP
ncbi:MAG TPA: AraC family transcriptional regulator [Dinghuibacter sp.]|uniref:helix-turn-helix domain-containing protein n=1 Tax=Dinghuibacter sp. TaxID=2024697 RepID=UPI002B56A62A|nr:AraC family transcriptional regulator [Dinghuibacter sp.]HTJ12845.1 AraC family transcriptional regulator [Dinghuibacter sp.]